MNRMRVARVSAVAGVVLCAVIAVRLVLVVLGAARLGPVDNYLYVIAATLISNTCSYHWGREDGARHERRIMRESRRIRRGAAPGDASLAAPRGNPGDPQVGARVGPGCIAGPEGVRWAQCFVATCWHKRSGDAPWRSTPEGGFVCPCHDDDLERLD